MRVQGLQNFNYEKYKDILLNIFGPPPIIITKEEIREKLLRNGLSKPLLRHVPDIYYIFTEEKPIILTQKQTFDIIDKYKKVVMYERKQKIKLSSSKKYFLQKFILKLDIKYHKILYFHTRKFQKNTTCFHR